MRIKKWNDFLSYIKESKSEKELGFWKIEEDDIRDYFQESIDEGYKIQVEFGFVGQSKYYSSRHYSCNSAYGEEFTKKIVAGKNQPAISIKIEEDRPSNKDVSDNLKFAHSIISEEADAEIAILDSDGEIRNIDGVVAKGGLFLTDTQQAEDYIEFLVKQKEIVDITQKQLAEHYKWGSYETKGDLIFVEYSLEDLADEMLARDANYKDILINGDDGSFHDNHWNSDYQPDLDSLFQYHLEKESKEILIKALIKEAGGLEQFVSSLGNKCDAVSYDEIKSMMEDKEGEPESDKQERKTDDIAEYLIKDRFNSILKKAAKGSDIVSDIQQSYGDWAANAHADKNLQEIKDEFDSILDKNFTYEKGTREVEKKYKDTSGNFHTYRDEETFYSIKFSNDWIEDMEIDDLENEKLTNIFEAYLDTNEMTRYELDPHFSDYGNVDDKAWNRDVKSNLIGFLKNNK